MSYTKSEKLNYYTKRINDKKLSPRQREYALNRAAVLTPRKNNRFTELSRKMHKAEDEGNFSLARKYLNMLKLQK
ncbi:hypothetical protein KQ51_01387 [Candidatus Izimaplasma bacterium HR1]|jgi:hypothetical protein|uniref:hypothetical protein n=1 Tax=Candidatus Izimoplasma sp. HR1 TaxID=1541959 RepID=UPI0004F61ABB|nr:hypothetical protein KQ51_01387 [Candidatus Izimaplasma bacterium HR1]